jgi:hypothetical protein
MFGQKYQDKASYSKALEDNEFKGNTSMHVLVMHVMVMHVRIMHARIMHVRVML